MKNMMLKTSLAFVAIVASLANAFEEVAEEHNTEMEDIIISGLDSVLPKNEKFYSFTSHLGQPAMHDEI